MKKNNKNNLLRPTSSKVLKSLFDIINNYNLTSNLFLDLFAGSGYVGIYAKNKGFDVISVEKNKLYYNKINKLIQQKNTTIQLHCQDAIKYLNNTPHKFDVIFVDPPYFMHKLYTDSIGIIKEKKLLNQNGIIVVEKNSKNQLHFSSDYYNIKHYFYGDTEIAVLSVV